MHQPLWRGSGGLRAAAAKTTKIVEHKFAAMEDATCAAGQSIRDATTCFAVAPTLGIHATRFANKTVSDPKLPEACSVLAQSDGSAIVYFNTGGNGGCNGASKRTGEVHSGPVTLSMVIDSPFVRSAKGKFCSGNQHALKRFFTKSAAVSDGLRARDQCEAYCQGESKCWGCSVDMTNVKQGLASCSWNAITSCGDEKPWNGFVEGDITQKAPHGDVVTITMSGPSDKWFGVGLNATQMNDQPYTLIANSSGIFEQRLGTCGDEGSHCAGTWLAPSVTVTSNSVASGVRTIVMTRKLQGITKSHYSFGLTDATLPLITAVGQSNEFAYHGPHGHSTAEISLIAAGSSTCICSTGQDGKL